MTAEQLIQVLRDWQLNAAQAAKVLCVHTNKMSEYLSGVTPIPCCMAFHIDALQQILEDQRNKLFQQRINRKSHQAINIK